VKTAVVAALLGVVVAASALDLALGLLWVGALMGLLLLRRRLRLAPWLALAGIGALVVWGARLGWFPPPPPASYETGWVPGWGTAPAAVPPAPDPEIEAVRERLAALGREEGRLTGPELEQRAGAVIALSRRLDPVRGEAPREVALVEGAARRLARTLAAPEFRDLETRRAAAAAHVADLERRLGAARDAREAAAVLRAADPAAMAHVSLRSVREDLAAAGAAVESLVGRLGGGVPSATAAARARYDEDRREVRWEIRYTVAGAARVRLLRLETRAFRDAAPSGTPLKLEYAAAGEPARPVPPGAWAELDPAPREAAVIATWTEPVAVEAVRARLRPLAFERLEVAPPGESDDAVLVVVFDGLPGLEWPLALRLPPPRLAQVAVPRHALYFARRPGAVALDGDGERWEAAGEAPERLRIELVPRSVFLRNEAFARVRGYLYRPNVLVVALALGLAALTLVLVRRPRPAVPAPG
jgi:hypothetical protein